MEIPYVTSSPGPPLLPARAEFLEEHNKEVMLIIENYSKKAKIKTMIFFITVSSVLDYSRVSYLKQVYRK